MPLRQAWEIGRKNTLEVPGRFVVEKVLRIQDRKWKFSAKNYRKWHRTARLAKSMSQLLNVQVDLPSRKTRTESYGLSRSIIESQYSEVCASYVEQTRSYLSELKPSWEEERKRGKHTLLSDQEKEHLKKVMNGESLKEGFFDGVVKSFGVSREQALHAVSVREFVSCLDAVFCHRKHVLWQVLTTQYNFEKDSNAIYDLQQLYYLSDPNYSFVTEDRRLRKAIEKSAQAERVLSLDDLIRLVLH